MSKIPVDSFSKIGLKNTKKNIHLLALSREKVDEAKAVIFFREKAFFFGVKKSAIKSLVLAERAERRKDNIWYIISLALESCASSKQNDGVLIDLHGWFVLYGEGNPKVCTFQGYFCYLLS